MVLWSALRCANYTKQLVRLNRIAYLILLFRRLIILMALCDDPLLLLQRRDVTLDDGVQLLAHIVLNIHFIIHYFAGYCLLEFRCRFFPCTAKERR